MTVDELKRELESLKKEVDALAQKRESAEAAEVASPASVLPTDAVASLRQMTVDGDFSKVSELLSSALDDLADDVKQSRPKALVAAFLAGVAVGKVL